VGTLALGLAASLSIREAIIIANIAAGLVVGKVGTATISLGELQSAV
jgi:D-beta-D-heptose 7-phosphate kinase/D-beta-D-heptose 1-phosphate adenosyltransferase